MTIYRTASGGLKFRQLSAFCRGAGFEMTNAAAHFMTVISPACGSWLLISRDMSISSRRVVAE